MTILPKKASLSSSCDHVELRRFWLSLFAQIVYAVCSGIILHILFKTQACTPIFYAHNESHTLHIYTQPGTEGSLKS